MNMLFYSFKYMPPVGMRHGIRAILRALLSCGSLQGNDINPGISTGGHYFSFDSGKAALLVALQAVARVHDKRVNVIVPAYTCFSVAAVVEQVGLKMVLCDILPETLDFDYEMLSTLADENTLCILPTHLFGKSADVARVKKMADSCDAFVIEDSAQSLPDVDASASGADVVVYSFGRGKPYSTGGGGGLFTLREDVKGIVEKLIPQEIDNSFLSQTSAAIKILINDLLISPYIYWLPASLPFLKIGKTIYPDSVEIEGMINFKKILINDMDNQYPRVADSRHVKSNYYHQSFLSAGIAEKIVHLGVGYFKPIRYPFYSRTRVKQFSDDQMYKMARLGVVKMYPCGLHKLERVQPFFVNKQMAFPGADWIAEHLLSLPVHALVSQKHQARVINCIKSCVQ